jgi:hypothetical protein
MIVFRSSFVSALFLDSIHTSENTVSVMRRYENSVERNTSGTSAMLLSLDVKFVKIFRKETEYYKGYCNSSPNLHNRLTHMDIITASHNSVYIG